MAEKNGLSLAEDQYGAECAPLIKFKKTPDAASAKSQENQRWQIR
jgi:hypothetical protein